MSSSSRLCVGAWLLIVAALSACTEPFDREGMLRSIVNRVLMPAHRDLATQLGTLAERSSTFCAAPTVGALADARLAWDVARSAQKQIDVFAFGPYSDPALRYGVKLDSWPVRADTVDAVLTGTTSLEETAVSQLGATSRGLPVMEYLLHGEGDASLVAFSSDSGAARRCAYLVGASKDAASLATLLAEAWDPLRHGHAEQLLTAGKGSAAYPTLRDAVKAVFNQSVFMWENARELKLARPIGRTTGTPQPELLESRPSGRSIADLLDDLAGFDAVYLGRRGDLPAAAGVLGFRDYVQARSSSLDRELRVLLEATRAAYSALSSTPLAEAMVSRAADVETAYQATKALHRFLAVEVASVLGVTVTFNDTDGD